MNPRYEPQYVKRVCPEYAFDMMQVSADDASILFCPYCRNATASLVGLPRFERDIQMIDIPGASPWEDTSEPA
jgi:hypothetical protein